MKYAIMGVFLLLVLLVIGMGMNMAGRDTGVPCRQGNPVDFTMTDTNNQPVTLSNFRGKVVVLFVFATWCHYCANERPGLIDMQNNANNNHLPLQIIGIAADTDRDAVRSYVNANGINYIVVFMDPSQMGPFGNITGYPVNIIINKSGEIVDRIVGYVDEQTLNSRLQPFLNE